MNQYTFDKTMTRNMRMTMWKHALLLLMMVMGTIGAWGQTPKVADGIYYIKNNNDGGNKWYLWPAITVTKSGDTFQYAYHYLTTHDGQTANAVTDNNGVSYPYHDNTYCHWVVKNVEGGYIQLINPKLNKYVVIVKNHKLSTGQDVKLDDEPAEINYSYFVLNNNSSPYKISPSPGLQITYDSHTNNPASYSLNSKNGNDRTWLTWSSSDNSGARAELEEGIKGVIQFYWEGKPLWSFTKDLLAAPNISDVDETANTFTITDANGLPNGYTIRYTTDGEAPTATTGEVYKDPVLVEANCTVKAVVVRYGVVLTEVAEKELSPVIAKPTFSFDNSTNKVSISSVTTTANIYYNTGDGSQADPTVSPGNLYSTPFVVTSPTTVKAIASLGDNVSSVAIKEIEQVATPTIQNNGSNAISITSATEGATIYYTTDGSTPTTESTEYTNPLTDNISNVTIKAIAVKDGMINSAVGSDSVKLQCATPIITRDGMTFTISCTMPTDATFYYTIGDGAETLYNGPVSFTTDKLPTTVTAVAKHNNYTDSESASMELINGSGTPSDPYMIYGNSDFATFVTNVNNGTTASACYKLGSDVSASGTDAITTPFTGSFDGDSHTITGLSHPLFNTVDSGTVKNVILDNVSVSSAVTFGDNKKAIGAIAGVATGTTRIYNCGILATNSTVETDDDGYTKFTSCSSSVGGTADYVGGLVGFLDGEARVINCYSYANITGGSEVGGIVGHNNVATTSSNLKTMVMNCMYYGDITVGTNKAPIYNGTKISNEGQSGVGNYNYFWGGASYVTNLDANGNPDIQTYNCALMAETRFLQRFEFFRHLLNSHRELAAWWATGDKANKDQMMKWVLKPSQIGTSTPYPILKQPDYYPSVVNLDAENATLQTERNKGGDLGDLVVTIEMGSGGDGDTAPVEASITTSSLTLNITDKDFDHFNFNYYKVQLPYYNDVGTNNYRKASDGSSRVVTGWKITSIRTGTNSFTTGEDATATVDPETDAITLTTPYNFADRNCTAKDLYSSTNKRVFNQGAYFDVPEGVTAITIQPYWAKAAYVADSHADVVYSANMKTPYNVGNVGGGQIYTNAETININGEDQTVYTSIANAVSALEPNASNTVNDYAVVLVGNYHQYNGIEGGNKPYTLTSIDLDHDNEPDYSFILRFDGRTKFHPVKYDFINLVGLGMAQKSASGTATYNFGIPQPTYWFETTNTSLFRVTQFEYDHKNRTASPIILQGGVMEQWVSGQNESASNKTTYFHVGGNVWFKEFHLGCHQDREDIGTKHSPVSVTGGDFDEFYLTGLYAAKTKNMNDNAECYINGGRFGIVAGAGMEGIGDATNHTKGNITWQIDNADITEFYGGGINGAKPIQGNITTVISNSYVHQFCGGPKFGDMETDREVRTSATNCTFDTYFGAGYGGNSYNRQTPFNYTSVPDNIDWNNWVEGKQMNGNPNQNLYFNGYKQEYKSAYDGVSTQIDYQFLPMSDNASNVARLWIEYVKFSLATTHEVTSTLTGCTITQNFYGGGNLGKVDGEIKSTLTNCNVLGNVFGAGFSASLPQVKVMNTGGFATEPSYNKNLGVYMDGVFPPTVPYTWEHKETVNSTETAIDKTNHILYTQVDISPSNLGSVAGNVTLTIKGSSVIGTEGNSTKGNVFGGGESSYVTGADHKVTINLQGETQVLGSVFGGGDKGLVEGSTEVNIKE